MSSFDSLDVEGINRDILRLEQDKVIYENKLKELPNIQKRNRERVNLYNEAMESWDQSEQAKRDRFNSLLDQWQQRDIL